MKIHIGKRLLYIASTLLVSLVLGYLIYTGGVVQ